MNPTISIFTRHNDLEPSANLPLTKVLEAIRQPRERVTKLIASIRSEPDKAKRRELKGQLPAICFGAQLKTRDGKASATEKIHAESGIVCLDLDDIEELDATKARLEGQKHILAVFVSPSGNGLKVLVPILGGFQTHWRALAHHMESEYQLKADEARKDVVGLCYASHDPAIWVAPDMSAVEAFAEVREDPRPRHQPGQTLIGHMPNDGEVLSEYLDAKNAEDALAFLPPDCEYPEWIEIGQAIHCQFGGSGQGLAIWDSWSSRGSKYAGSEDVSRHYQSFRASGITFKSVLKKAFNQGYKAPRRTSSTAVSVIPPPAPVPQDILGEFIESEADGSFSVVDWPWPELSKLSQSLYPGGVTILCGASGSNKSWFTLTCLNYWTSIGVSAQALMVEQGTKWHLNRLLAMLERNTDFLSPSKTKASPALKRAAYIKHKKAIAVIQERITCILNITMSACAQWVEDRCAEGARILIIDPITMTSTGSESKWVADQSMMARAIAACEKSGTSLMLVSHPAKVSGGAKGPPQMDDMAGGAVYNRAASSLLWLVGSDEQETIIKNGEQKTMDVHKKVTVLKARNGIGTGKSIGFQFNALNFEEMGMIVPSLSKNKKKNQCSVAKELEEMEKTRRSMKISSKPQDDEDSFLGQSAIK